MGIEVLVIGTIFTVGAFILFLLLALTMPTEYSVSEASLVRYFKAHPTRFQIIFYLMFLAFPLNFGIAMMPQIALFSQARVGEIITFLFLMWPTFMYLAHRGFSSFSKALGISSNKKQRLNPMTRATLYIIGWFGSITSFCLFIFIVVNGIDTIVRTPLFFFGYGFVFIPFRKSIAIIRGKERTEYKS